MARRREHRYCCARIIIRVTTDPLRASRASLSFVYSFVSRRINKPRKKPSLITATARARTRSRRGRARSRPRSRAARRLTPRPPAPSPRRTSRIDSSAPGTAGTDVTAVDADVRRALLLRGAELLPEPRRRGSLREALHVDRLDRFRVADDDEVHLIRTRVERGSHEADLIRGPQLVAEEGRRVHDEVALLQPRFRGVPARGRDLDAAVHALVRRLDVQPERLLDLDEGLSRDRARDRGRGAMTTRRAAADGERRRRAGDAELRARERGRARGGDGDGGGHRGGHGRRRGWECASDAWTARRW
eukprot:24215-Pelagococcus_subviridis.AAC.4